MKLIVCILVMLATSCTLHAIWDGFMIFPKLQFRFTDQHNIPVSGVFLRCAARESDDHHSRSVARQVLKTTTESDANGLMIVSESEMPIGGLAKIASDGSLMKDEQVINVECAFRYAETPFLIVDYHDLESLNLIRIEKTLNKKQNEVDATKVAPIR